MDIPTSAAIRRRANAALSYLALYKIPLLLGFLFWYITGVLQLDRLFYIGGTPGGRKWFLVHGISLAFILPMCCFISAVREKLKEGDVFVRRAARVAAVYLALSSFFVLVLWPGTWAWDDVWTLIDISNYRIFYWQNVMTSVWQHALLGILPFPAGIMVLQVLVTACIVGYLTALFERRFTPRAVPTLLGTVAKVAVFMTPPVIMYLYSGYRLGIYVFLEIFVLGVMICYRRRWQEASWQLKAFTAFLVAVISVWRTECFVYVPLCLLLLGFDRSLSASERRRIIAGTLLVFLALHTWQQRGLGNSNYEIVSLARPLTEAVREAGKSGKFSAEDQPLIDAIDKVVKVDMIFEKKNSSGEGLYWSGFTRQNYSDDDYKNLLKAFVDLSLRYPETVWHERSTLFMNSLSWWGKKHYTNVDAAADLELGNNNATAAFVGKRGDYHWILTEPVIQARSKAIRILGIQFLSGVPQKLVYSVFWSPLPEILMFLGILVYCLVKRRWFESLILGSFFFRIGVIFLTSPTGWYMYFHSFLFMGQVLMVCAACCWLHRRRSRASGEAAVPEA